VSIDDGFKKLLAGVRMADDGRDEIMRGLEEAWSARKDLDEQLTDLRDSVRQLQGLVLAQSDALRAQGHQLRALYDRLEGGGA